MEGRELLEQILTNQISMQNDMNVIKTDMNGLKSKAESIENRLICVEEKLTKVESELTDVKGRLTNVENELTKTKDKVTDIEVYLENTIERNIRIIAEGHKNLNEKVDQVFYKLNTMGNDYEILSILVREHEHKLRKIG